MTGRSSVLTQAPAIQCVPGGYSPMTARMVGDAAAWVHRPLTKGQQTSIGAGRLAVQGRVPPLAGEPRRLRLSVSPARVRTKVRYFPTEEPDYRAHPAGNYVLIATSREDRARHPEHGPPPARLHFLTTRETKQVSPLRATPDRAAGATTITVTEEDA